MLNVIDAGRNIRIRRNFKMDGFWEKMQPSLDNIYKIEVKDGEAKLPRPKLPDCAVERLNYSMPMLEDGMTFLGILNCVLAEDEEKVKKDFSMGAMDEWMPVTDEFKKWRDDYPMSRYHQMEIAVAIIYGFEGQRTMHGVMTNEQ